MPDADRGREPFSDQRSVRAMGERVAVVETKVATIERDTAVIRAACHSINGELQKSTLQGARWVEALERMVDQTKNMPELMVKLDELYVLKPQIGLLINESTERHGAWKAYVTAGSAVVGAVTIFGLMVSGILGLIAKFLPMPPPTH